MDTHLNMFDHQLGSPDDVMEVYVNSTSGTDALTHRDEVTTSCVHCSTSLLHITPSTHTISLQTAATTVHKMKLYSDHFMFME